MAKTEHDEQAELFRWARDEERLRQFPELRWMFAIPNGAKLPYYRNPKTGKTYSPQLMYLKAEGLLSGIADIFLPYPNGLYCGLFIEMKRGNKPLRDNQELFINDMRANGYRAEVCRSAKEAEELILEYLSDDIQYSNDLGDDYD